MDTRNLDAATLAHGRRAALRTAGMSLASLAALPLLAHNAAAKKRGKNKKSAGKAKDRCRPQVAACETVAATFCENVLDPALCRAGLIPCCQPLGTCNGDQSIQCVIDALARKSGSTLRR